MKLTLVCFDCDVQVMGGVRPREDMDEEWHANHCVVCGQSRDEIAVRREDVRLRADLPIERRASTG